MLHKELFELIKDLNPVEIELINRTIKNSSYIETNEMRLFDFLLNQAILPQLRDVCKAVYRKSSPKSYDSFKKLVYRSKHKVLEAIMLCNDSFVNFQKELDEYTPKDPEIIKVVILRKAIVIQSFLEKRSPNFMKHLLDDIIQQSAKNEFYYLTVEYLVIKMNLINSNEGEGTFNKIKEQIAFYEGCRDAVNKAKENYIKFTIFNCPFQNPTKHKEEVVNNIQTLKENLKIIKSDNIKYYLCFYELILNLINEDYLTVKEKSIELLQFISEKHTVKSKEKLLTITSYLIKSEVHLKNYDQALILLNKSQIHLESGSIFQIKFKEYEFLTNIYLKHYEQAEEVLLLKFKNTSAYNLLEKEKLSIYKANLNFIRCEYKEVNDKLYLRKETLKDVTGQEYNCRILKLFINLFQGKEDEVIRDFDCLKKQVKRNSILNKGYSCRNLIIFKIMQHICKKNYNVHSNDIKLNNLMDSLKASPWQPFGSELIPVEEIMTSLLLKVESARIQELN
ncbi:MAG: hypothetical protein H0V01_04370 [Bacteroidetes bacterium]|nr:hypothetical protein [Bacteroidota bacterium]HET6243886.1 hypothetical protein [Bacteroidia bacterium]